MFDYIMYLAAILGFVVGIAFTMKAIRFVMKWFMTVLFIAAAMATIFLMGAFSNANW
jgi:hypothetical protein